MSRSFMLAIFALIALSLESNCASDLRSRVVEAARMSNAQQALLTCPPVPTDCPCGVVRPLGSLCRRCKINCPATTTAAPSTVPPTAAPTTTKTPTTTTKAPTTTTKAPTTTTTTVAPTTTRAPTSTTRAPTTTTTTRAPTAAPTTTRAPTPAPTTTRAPTTTSAPGTTQVWSPRYGDSVSINCPYPAQWTLDVSTLPVHAQSNTWKSKASRTTIHPDFGGNWDGGPFGIPYTVVKNVPLANIDFSDGYPDESDYYAGTQPIARYPFPITNPPLAIEGAPQGDFGDQHALVLDAGNCMLFETYVTSQVGNSFVASNGAVFNLNNFQDRPIGWTSADAAGLPILPGLITYDEVVNKGVINHAIRYTVSTSQQGFIYPARHFAGSQHNNNYPPMGARLRLKSSFDCNTFASTEAKVICTAMKKYGMIVADNGSDWYISGAPHPQWSDDHLGELKSLNVINNFEYIDTGAPICTSSDCSTVSPVYPTGGQEWV